MGKGGGLKPLSVGIVGCGTAGQAAAIFLRRAGHRVTILERAPTLSPIGAGLLLQPTGMEVLNELGMLPHLLQQGSRVKYLKGVNRSGRVILDLAYEDLRAGLFGLGIHRGELFTTLQSAVHACGAEVVCGFDAASLRESGAAQRMVVDASGNTRGPFDLVVIADGARSSLRSKSDAVRRAHQYPWGALWLVAMDHEGKYGETLAQIYGGTRSMIGFLPSGSVRGSPRTVSVFWSVPCGAVESIRRSGLEAWRTSVRQLTNQAEPILDQVRDMDQLIFAAYQDVVMDPCPGGPVAFLGDAAHAMSPQLGQGANLALMDAWALARSLDLSGSIPDALVSYRAERAANVRFYQFTSRWLTPVFQSRHEWITPVRDRCMGPAGNVGWIRREMLRSLAGVKTGLFSSRPLPQPMVQ